MATRKRDQGPVASIRIEPTEDGAHFVSIALPGCVPITWKHLAGDARRAAEKMVRRIGARGASPGEF